MDALCISNNNITVGTANAVANGQDGGDKPATEGDKKEGEDKKPAEEKK